MNTLTPLQRLEYTEDIKRLKARYFRSVDMQDWVAFAAVFTDDATLEVERSGGPATIIGSAAIVALVQEYLRGARSVHHGHMPEIHVESAERATGVWSMEDRLHWSDHRYHGFGHYHERYVRTHEGWRIHYCRLVRISLEHLQAARHP